MLHHWPQLLGGVLAAPVVYALMVAALLVGQAFTAAPPI